MAIKDIPFIFLLVKRKTVLTRVKNLIRIEHSYFTYFSHRSVCLKEPQISGLSQIR